MIKIRCHTNLDLRNEEFPEHLPEVPRVGDYIQSAVEHGQSKTRIELKVVSVHWQCVKPFGDYKKEWIPMVELHLSPYFVSVAHFTYWYDYICGHISHERYRMLSEEAYKAAKV